MESKYALVESQQDAEREQRELSVRLQFLLDATSRMIEALDSKELLGSVLEVSSKIVEADAFAVWRADRDGNWSAVETSGLSEEYIRETLHHNDVNALPVDVVVVQPEVLADRSTPLLRERWARYDTEGISSLMILPLRIRGEVSGTLVFYSRKKHRFSDVEIKLARTLSHIVAAAITTVELYEFQSQLRRSAESAAVREAFLAEAGAILTESLDYEKTLGNVARAAVPDFADWCVVDLLLDDETLHRVAVAHADPEKVSFAQAIHERYPPDRNAEIGTWNIIRTGVPEMLSVIPDSLIEAAARDEEHLRLMREVQLGSYISTPIWSQNRVCGVISFVQGESGRYFDENDLNLARELALRASQAVEHARLYRDVTQSEARFRQIAETVREVFYIIDGQGVRYVSPAYEAIWERKVDALYDDPFAFMSSVHPDDIGIVRQTLRKQWNGAFTELEFRIVLPSGAVRWIHDRGFPIIGNDGKVSHIVGDAEDISARKNAERLSEVRALQQKVVAELGEMALREQDLDVVLNNVSNAVTRTLGTEFCKILELQPDGENLLLRAGQGWSAGLVGSAILGAGAGSQAAFTLAEEAPVIVRDLRKETRFNRPELLLEHGVRSGMTCIIQSGPQIPWGVLGVHSSRLLEFTKDDVNFIVSVANVLGGAAGRNHTENELRDLTNTLELRVDERTRQVRELSSVLTRSQQEERRRISRILHDNLQQQLYGIQMKLNVARKGLSGNAVKGVAQSIERAEEWLKESIETTRSLTVNLSPPILKNEGLTSTLQWLASDMYEKQGLEVSIISEHTFDAVDADIRVLLFQIVRELLFNVVKHAGTSQAEIQIQQVAGQVRLDVSDQGNGFSTATLDKMDDHDGFGIRSSRERLRLFGGEMTIQSNPGKGTCITVIAPFEVIDAGSKDS